MFERYITADNLRERLAQSITSQSGAAMETLRENFAPLINRLSPEVEPATVFLLRPASQETPQ